MTGSSLRKPLSDPSLHAPTPQLALEALDLWKNTDDNLPDHEDFVLALRAIKAALGPDREQYYPRIEQWAHDYPGITKAYIRGRWDSFSDSTVGWRWLCSLAAAAGFTGQAQLDFATDKDPNANIPKTKIEEALERYVYVKKQAEYHDITNGSVLTSDRDFNAAHTEIADYGSSGRQSAAAAFLNSDGARKVDTVTSRPGRELIMDETNEFGASVTAINLWRPSTVKRPDKHGVREKEPGVFRAVVPDRGRITGARGDLRR